MPVRLTTLGTIRATDGAEHGEVILAGQQPKRLALLAYLAIARPRGSHRRDSLVALLWPELDQEHARAALRQALHGLRKSLGADTLVSDGTESIELSHAAVRCDVWELEQAAADGDHEQVVALYTGDLADGLFASGVPAFEQWLDRERRRVRDIVRESAWEAATHAEQQRKPVVTVERTRLALSLSEFDEDALRRAMRLLAAAGERAGALAAYERFVIALRRELDTEPSDETRALAALLRQRTPDRVATAPVLADANKHTPVAPSLVSSRPRWRTWRPIIAGILSIGAVATAARLAPSAGATIDPRRIRVAAFANEADLPLLDTMARVAESTVRSALVRLDNAQVIAPASGSGADADRAGTIVRGTLRLVADTVEIRTEVVDQISGSIVRSIVGRLPRAHGEAHLESFADRVSAAVATALYPGWGTALSQPPSYAGYRLFLDGMRSIKLEQHEVAAAAFRRAFNEDSSFTAAGLLAAGEFYQMSRFGVADSIVRAIAPRRALLPPVDGHLFDWLTRSLHGDRIGARSAMTEIVKVAPTADLAWLQLAIDNVETARPIEALAALDHIERSAEFGEGWASYWATRAEALHILGDHQRELAVVRDGLKRHPELRVLVGYELRALASLGRVREVDAGMQSLSATADSAGLTATAIMRQVALELAAHGHRDAAARVLRQTLAWFAARPEGERSTLAFQLAYARSLYLADTRPRAMAIYDSLKRVYPKCFDCAGALGVLAARAHDRVTVDSSIAMLNRGSYKYSFGRNSMWLARIAATAGNRDAAVAHLNAAFAAGAEFDVMTHADADLASINPDSLYRVFARR